MPIGALRVIDTIPQSSTYPFAGYFLMREDKADITLTATVVVGDSTISVSSGHGFTVGSWVSIFEDSRFQQVQVTGVSTDDITVSLPLSYAFTSSAVVIRGVINQAVDGSVTPQHFVFNPRASTTPIDVAGARLSIVMSGAGDDGTFGNLSALTNGWYARRSNHIVQNLGNYQTNGAFYLAGWGTAYPDKAPSGTYSFQADIMLKEVYTQEARIDPRDNDYIESVVRDNLSGLTSFVVYIAGSYTKGE